MKIALPLGFTLRTVDKIEAEGAPEFIEVQRLSTTDAQQVQQQSLGSHRVLQISISA